MDPNMMAMLAGGGAPSPGPGGAEYQMDLQGVSPDAAMDMRGGSPDAAMDPMMMAAGPPPGPGMPPADIAAGGPMSASALPTTDPGQIMAIISQLAAKDQQTAAMRAVAQTKLMQAQAMQPVAAAMLQEAVSQAQTMDMGGGSVGGM